MDINEPKLSDPVTIDVAPIATISIDVLGNWYIEMIAVTEKGVQSIVRTSTNLTQLFNQVRTNLHLNKDYYAHVAMRAAQAKKQREEQIKTESEQPKE